MLELEAPKSAVLEPFGFDDEVSSGPGPISKYHSEPHLQRHQTLLIVSLLQA